MRSLQQVLATVVVLGSCVSSASATTWYVDPYGTADAPTIQAGIDSAAAGDTVSLTDGTYTGPGNRDIDFLGKAIVVKSEHDDPALCVIDCQASSGDPHRGFTFQTGEGSGSVVSGLTVMRGHVRNMSGLTRGGGMTFVNSSPSISNCRFVNNLALAAGALYYENSSAVVEDCLFQGNTGEVWGGAISCGPPPSQVLLKTPSSLLVVNKRPGESAITNTVTISRCIFNDNGSSFGGAIMAWNGTSISLDRCLLHGNTAIGGIVQFYESVCSISSCSFVDNSFAMSGSTTIYCENSSLNVVETIIALNYGSAVFCQNCSPSISCTDIVDNLQGDWTGCIAGQETVNGNLFTSPLFCNPLDADFTLRSDSPCLPANNTCGVLMGARDLGCDAPPVHKTRWYVKTDGSGDAPTIGAAMDSALAGDTVVAACGTHAESNIYVKSGVYLTSETGNPDCVTIDGELYGPILRFTDTDRMTVCRGVTVTRGGASGVVLRGNAEPRFLDCVISDCISDFGGGVACWDQSAPEFQDCAIIDNSGWDPSEDQCGYGSGVYCGSGTSPIFEGCVIAGNSTLGSCEGGGVACYLAPGDTASFIGCTIVDNSSVLGAGLYVNGGGVVILDRTIIAFNSISAAVICGEMDSTSVHLQCCDVYGNNGGDWVGCIVDKYGLNGNFGTNPLFCDLNSQDYTLSELSDCLPENNTCAVLIGAVEQGCDAPTGVMDRRHPRNPREVSLSNYPNPFNPVTTFRVGVPDRRHVHLMIFNIEGKLVAVVADEMVDAGFREYRWGGTDEKGNQVGSGVYFYRLTAGKQTLTKKMVFLK